MNTRSKPATHMTRWVELRYVPNNGWQSRIVNSGDAPGEGEGLTPWRCLSVATASERNAHASLSATIRALSPGAVVRMPDGTAIARSERRPGLPPSADLTEGDDDGEMDPPCEHHRNPVTCVWCASGESPDDYR